MCIRDSLRTRPQTLQQGVVHRARAERRGVVCGQRCAAVGGEPRTNERTAPSVSYTHLRAHETVLDLVCRLLLEKKKTLLQHITFVT